MIASQFYQVLLFSTVLFVVICLALSAKHDDDEDEDPFTTTDPKKREPSPCESMCTFNFGYRLQDVTKEFYVKRVNHQPNEFQ